MKERKREKESVKEKIKEVGRVDEEEEEEGRRSSSLLFLFLSFLYSLGYHSVCRM
jgi:hypothetical protein